VGLAVFEGWLWDYLFVASRTGSHGVEVNDVLRGRGDSEITASS
jgi:hypothetical protein